MGFRSGSANVVGGSGSRPHGRLRRNCKIDDVEHPVPEIVAFPTTVMTLNPGDVLSALLGLVSMWGA